MRQFDVAGTWVRTGCASFLTGCKITMTIVQGGPSLSGSFTWDGTSGGTLSGTVANRNVSASLVPRETPQCQLAVIGTITNDQWSGSMTFGCTGSVIIDPTTEPVDFIRKR